ATDSTYTRSSVTSGDAGSYSVVVTNSFSSATSANAMLSVVSGSSSIIAQWNMNDISITNSPVPSTGSGTAALIGGTTATFAGGSTTDTSSVNNGWNTAGYPASGGANKSGGAQFTVSSAGYENIRFVYDQRNSGTASKYMRLQYTTNGTLWV